MSAKLSAKPRKSRPAQAKQRPSKNSRPNFNKKQYVEDVKSQATSSSRDTFAQILKNLIPRQEDNRRRPVLQSAPLTHLDYINELKIKNSALASFWKKHRLAGRPEQLTPSPRPRQYRTTSKRKALLHGPTLYLLLGEKVSNPKKMGTFHPSPLEPAEHEQIYRFLQQKLSEPAYRLVASHLNYLIIRGSYLERAVIFNVNMMNGPLVRKLKLLAGHLQKLQESPVSAAFVFFDPSRSDYYLESKRNDDALHFKKLFGPDQLSVNHADCRFHFHPTSFSQVNESMVPEMLRLAQEMLAPADSENLLDLYCGYGLFSHFLAPQYNQITAIDFGGSSIQSAITNSRLNSKRGGKLKFLAKRITGGSLNNVLASAPAPDSVILDPPKQGPQSGVIETICQARPKTVLHIFCGVDQIPESLGKWKVNGYKVRRIVPLDMFPGTANLEVLILLSDAR
ncbi:MAG: hypothetical protein KQH63_21425 [Desulfobulbaceae bacterium]|nr:hypothetical protein [Desulfobulbaceae bacterium]